MRSNMFSIRIVKQISYKLFQLRLKCQAQVRGECTRRYSEPPAYQERTIPGSQTTSAQAFRVEGGKDNGT